VVTLTIHIDGEMAAELNQFRPKLEATLILHVGLGKDHFIPVSATYGMSFHIPRPSPTPLPLGPGCVRVVRVRVGGFTRASIGVIRTDMLRERALILDAAQEADKGYGVSGRPTLRRRREERTEGSDEARQPHDVRRRRCSKWPRS